MPTKIEVEAMPQTDHIERYKDKQPKRVKIPVGVLLFGLFVLGGIVALVLIALYYSKMEVFPAWVNFLADSVLALLLFAVATFQAVIYLQQRNLMQSQLEIASIAVEPRLRITSVRVEDFDVGKEPVFIISIINEGATDARNVEIHIEASIGDDLTLSWSRPQIVSISARQKEHYFVPWRTILNQDRFNDLKDSARIQVFGYFKRGAERTEFCYRYYPWKGKRPDKVSQFTPCDFNPSLIVGVKAMSGSFSLAGGVAELKVTRAKRKEQEDEKKPGQAEPTESE